MIHFDGSGTSPSGPSSGKVGVIGKYGSAEQPGQRLGVADHRVDLLGPDDRARDDRRAGAQRGRDEPAAAEALQLVALAERLADALEALRPHPDELARRPAAARRRRCRPGCCRPCGRAAPTTGSGRPGRRRACRRCRWAGWWSSRASAVISASSGSVPEWLATTSAPPVVRHVLEAARLDPEPVAVERPQRRQQRRAR